MASRPAVFLDRDGTLNVQLVRDGKPYAPERLDEFRLYEGAPEACRALKAAGFVLVVATNQPDVGRGLVARETIEAMHALLLKQIPEIDRVEVSYDPGRGELAPRRKPEPGMLLDAARELDLDLSRSWMVGDRWKDIVSGKKAGVRTVYIDYGYSDEFDTEPDYTVKTFPEAAAAILAADRSACRT
ncbi:MAG: HAD-IIIA family hydrolase [Opitutaceae bacterium]|jgi:D-glycero-D-manno-heptose 1,7-bisphosphate phosphatase